VSLHIHGPAEGVAAGEVEPELELVPTTEGWEPRLALAVAVVLA
jgi:hypothetical protein